MRKINLQKKQGVSEIVAYVLLITIAITLSILVYNWIKPYVQDHKTLECDEGTRLVIDNYICYEDENGEKKINVTVKNRGLFNVDGFVLRANERANADIGIHKLGQEDFTQGPLEPGDTFNNTYSFGDELDEIALIEVQPFIIDRQKIYCKDVSYQTVSDCFN